MSCAVGSNSLAVKSRLGQLPLPAPELALTDQKALAQSSGRIPQPIMFDELTILVDENFFNEVGMIEEHHNPRSESRRHDVAIFVGPARRVASRSRPNSLKFPKIHRCGGPGGLSGSVSIDITCLILRAGSCAQVALGNLGSGHRSQIPYPAHLVNGSPGCTRKSGSSRQSNANFLASSRGTPFNGQ